MLWPYTVNLGGVLDEFSLRRRFERDAEKRGYVYLPLDADDNVKPAALLRALGTVALALHEADIGRCPVKISLSMATRIDDPWSGLPAEWYRPVEKPK